MKSVFRFLGLSIVLMLHGCGAGSEVKKDSSALNDWGVITPQVELNAAQIRRTVLFAHGVKQNESDSCRETDDPYEFPSRTFARPFPNRSMSCSSQTAVIIGGPNGMNGGCPIDLGQCIDMTLYRSALRMSEGEARSFGLTISQNTLLVSNVRDLAGFYIAEIPLHGIQDVIFQVVTLPMPILGRQGGHAEIRVMFRPGYKVKLRAQWPFTGEVVREVSDLIFSLNAQGKKGFSYEIHRTAMDGSTMLASTINTLDFRIGEDYRMTSGVSIEQYRMDMTSEEKRKYVEYYLAIGMCQET